MTFECSLSLLSVVAAALYGTVLIARPAAWTHEAVKITAIGALAAAAYVSELPPLLIAALALSAWGCDACAETQRPAPVLALLGAALAFGGLFFTEGGGRMALLAEPWRNLGVAGAMAAGVGMVMWLWRGLGPLKPVVAVQAAALSLMVGLAFTLPYQLWPAMVGAVGLAKAQALWAAQRFTATRPLGSPRLIWWSYYTAQALILWAYLR